jgi:hypothetical protein
MIRYLDAPQEFNLLDTNLDVSQTHCSPNKNVPLPRAYSCSRRRVHQPLLPQRDESLLCSICLPVSRTFHPAAVVLRFFCAPDLLVQRFSCLALICEEFALLLSHVSLSMVRAAVLCQLSGKYLCFEKEVVAEVRRRFTRDFEEAFLCSIDDVSTGMLFSDVPEKSFCRLFLIFFGYQSVGGRSICWPSPACIIWMATLH